MKIHHLVPAYGRDYNSKAAAQADWDAGRDFIIRDISSQWDGKPMSQRDVEPGDGIIVRYGKLRKVARLRPSQG